MPEGPETHALADRLQAALARRKLVEARFIAPALKPCEAALAGQRVRRVEARGKALLTRFGNGLVLYTHSHLFGFWRIEPAGDERPARAPPRVLLRTRDTCVRLFAAPSVRVVDEGAVEAIPYLAGLGPDVLDPATTADLLAQRLRLPKFARRTLAALLLDQAYAAGMGNYLRSEALFAARLSPHRTAADLDEGEAAALGEALVAVPRRAYRARLKGFDGHPKAYLADVPASFRFRVFERDDRPCPRCGGPVRQERLAQRRLYWCPHCQR
ncbi:endonuclease VIII [Luteimonas sp. Y-2-2-4F]|nr:endonuclease VIII [Luteimonas sp. Y-2-2-4F]MCD9032902.1 endonuclease VIII [Luteimonas sp. Y-2-2-4F]